MRNTLKSYRGYVKESGSQRFVDFLMDSMSLYRRVCKFAPQVLVLHESLRDVIKVNKGGEWDVVLSQVRVEYSNKVNKIQCNIPIINVTDRQPRIVDAVKKTPVL